MLQYLRKQWRNFFLVLALIVLLYFVCRVFITLHLWDHSIFDQLMFALAVVGIALGFYSTCVDAPKLRHGINKVIEETSTHFIGVFPAHLHHIREMVDNAKISLCIMVDCVDYGSFFDPELHDEVISAIVKSLRRKKPLTVKILITTDQPEPISRSSKFYGLPFEELLKDKEFKDIFNRYLSIHKTVRENQPKTDAEFRHMLQTQQEIVRGLLHDAGAHIYGLKGTQIINCNNVGDSQKQQLAALPLPNSQELFFWIADGGSAYDESAIFLFSHRINGIAPEADAPPVNGPDASGMAFLTHDSKLIEIFISIFAQHPERPVMR